MMIGSYRFVVRVGRIGVSGSPVDGVVDALGMIVCRESVVVWQRIAD